MRRRVGAKDATTRAIDTVFDFLGEKRVRYVISRDWKSDGAELAGSEEK